MNGTSRAIIGLLVVVIVILVVILVLIYTAPESTPNSQIATTTTATVTKSPQSLITPQDCGGCITETDNGRTVAHTVTSRVTLILPDAYKKDALTLSPKGSMGETFGASAPARHWVRTFEVTSPVTTTISVPATTPDLTPFSFTVIGVDEQHAWEDGMTVVDKMDSNQTIHLAKNERFIVQMGSDLNWSLSLDPSDAITRVPNSTTAEGIQGVYEAAKTGKATLTAIGKPICKAGQPCAQFLIDIKVYFDIQ